MTSAPYMPLYVGDYLADTAHLTGPEHGAYLLLLMNYWQRGKPLPDDDRKLAAIARTDREAWGEMRESIAELFEVEDGTWSHRRVERELARLDQKREGQSKAGRASGNVRREKAKKRSEMGGGNDPKPPTDPNGTPSTTHGNRTEIERPFNERSTNAEPIGEDRGGEGKIGETVANATDAQARADAGPDEADPAEGAGNGGGGSPDPFMDGVVPPFGLPPEPNVVVPFPTPEERANRDRTLAALRDAAGDGVAWGLIGIEDLSPISDWMAQGADLDRHILPVVRAGAQRAADKGDPISAWTYFAKPVARAMAAGRHVLPDAEQSRPPRPSRVDEVGAMRRVLDRLHGRDGADPHGGPTIDAEPARAAR